METYPDFFDEDGWTNMWGRSNVYRFAATSPLGAFAMFDEYRKCDENVFGNDVNREDIIKSEINGKDANGKKVRSDRGHNYGLFRRICSGSLLQFITREDFYYRGFPTMGFYGMFAPLVQGYSCAESPFWLGKAFLCLELPADHPFWTEKESNGTWEELEPGEVKVTTLDGPALAFSNHKANGSTILRTGKVVKRAGDLHGMWNYSKLAYHSKYPWEATPHVISGENGDGHGDDHDDSHGSKNDLNSEHAFEEGRNSGKEDNPESMQYVLTDLSDMHVERCNATFWCGMKDSQTINSKCKGKPLCHADRNDEDPQGIQIKEKDEVLYRRQFFNYSLDKETHWMQAIDLADFTVPYGIMRVDRIRLFKWPVVLTLGAFGFPDNGTEIIRKYQFTNDSEVIENSNRPDNCKATKGEDGLKASAVILKGTDSQGRKKQLAMTIYDGWDDLLTVRSEHTNPDSEKSVIVYAKTTRKKQYGGAEPHILISQVITKENHEDFQHDELFPIKEIRYSDPLNSGACGTIRILLKDGNVKMIDFTGNEGSMSL
ncbi:MAG: DUF2264 domain-containing protein [Lachnospiraceae bacterium]|nr:DUF2264 domain-containing protein [Lachnospiraceae bacterium]